METADGRSFTYSQTIVSVVVVVPGRSEVGNKRDGKRLR
jgi:hypothetical protein